MSRLAWLRLPWLFNRRVGVALLWTLLVVAAAVAVNIAGIHVVGGVEGWQHWLQAHAGHFFVWRLCLYGRRLTAGGGCVGACCGGSRPARRISACCARRSRPSSPWSRWKPANCCGTAETGRQA
jgi:hypothetical protein